MDTPDIPHPLDTGSSGTQTPTGDEVTLLEASSPFRGVPIAQAIEGLAATKARSLGGDVGATLLAGSFTQLTHDLETTRRALRLKENDFQRVTNELATSTTHAAVLDERLGSISRNQRIRQLAVFAGTALAGVAIDLWKSDMTKVAAIVGVLGVALLLFGALTPTGGAK